jgi:arylamine N-acetyltransferase
MLTRNGRLTLTDTKLIVTRGSRRFERPVRGPREFNRLLQAQFGIRLRLGASHDEVSGAD